MSSNRVFVNPLLTNPIEQPGSQDTTSFDLGIGERQSIVLSAEQAQGVRPGDVITSDLFNRLLARLAVLEASNATGILLGPLGANTHTLVALGTGFETGGGIFLDGVSLLSSLPQRGINLVILDPNLSVKFRNAYDTIGATSESARLANDLQAQAAAGDLVLVATHDAYIGLTDAAKNALAAVGGAALADPTRGRDNAAFIGVVPSNRANVRFNYLVSVMPADGLGFAGARLAALPFVWGIYSIPLKRFLIGGGSSSQLLAQRDAPPPPGVSGTLPPPATFAVRDEASESTTAERSSKLVAEGPAIDRANEPTESEPSEKPRSRKKPAARRRKPK